MAIALNDSITIYNDGNYFGQGNASDIVEALKRIGYKTRNTDDGEFLFAGDQAVAELHITTEDYGDDGEMSYLESIAIEKHIVQEQYNYLYAYLLSQQLSEAVQEEMDSIAAQSEAEEIQ